MTNKSIVVTGCSSGIGYCCAKGLRERGWDVIATARKDEDIERLRSEGLETIYLDYAEPDSIAAAADKITELTGGKLYGLFNNGAYGQQGAVEDLPVDALRIQLESNVIGWHDLTRRLLPLMRANGSGRIVQNSSVLGLIALKWRGAYNASKFALEGLSSTLRMELKGTGIHVSLIEPGPIISSFNENAQIHFKKHIDVEKSHYREKYEAVFKRFEKGHNTPVTLGPEAVLAKLLHALESPKPKAHYYVTLATHGFAILKRILPHRVFEPMLYWASDR